MKESELSSIKCADKSGDTVNNKEDTRYGKYPGDRTALVEEEADCNKYVDNGLSITHSHGESNLLNLHLRKCNKLRHTCNKKKCATFGWYWRR